MSQKGLPLEQRKKLMLSDQTIEGLKITGKYIRSILIICMNILVYSFMELVPYLLSLDGANFIMSERFNQDNVEVFFGKQRARCGRGDNPTVTQFLYNTQAIRTSRSMSFGSSSSIKRRLFHDIGEDELNEPLRKRIRKK